MIYDKIKRNQNNIVDIKNRVLISYINGPKVEILGSIDATYKIELALITYAVSYCFLSNMWKEILTSTFQNVVFNSI